MFCCCCKMEDYLDVAPAPLLATGCPTERVIHSLHKGNRDVLPQALAPALALEQSYDKAGYTVAYHCIPDTKTHGALVLYETYAFMAEMAHNIRHPLLPRLIRKHFAHPWGSIDTIAKVFTNDHAIEWRRIGIACSASMASQTEAPPYMMFASGYKTSGAPKPDSRPLLEELFMEYGCKDRGRAAEISKVLFESGEKIFDSVGGSMLQIFIHNSVAEKYLYATNSWTTIQYTGPGMTQMLKNGNLNSMQLRLVCHPDVLLDQSKAAIFHHQFHPTLYLASKRQFRALLQGHIFQSRVGNEIRIRFEPEVALVEVPPPAPQQSNRTVVDKRKRAVTSGAGGEEIEAKRRRLNVTTRSMKDFFSKRTRKSKAGSKH